MNRQDFFDKMVYEGGPIELYQYGLQPKHITDPEIKELWDLFCKTMDPANAIAEQLIEMMEDEE